MKKIGYRSLVIIATLVVFSLFFTKAASGATVTELRCESRVNPLGVDAPLPRLSWQMDSERSGDRQTAYQIWVASSLEKLAKGTADVWDSGKVGSDRSQGISMFSTPEGMNRAGLRSGQVCHWKVRVWDADGVASVWSPPAMWTMGLLEPGGWHAQWIGAGVRTPSDVSLWLRKEIVLEELPARAWAYLNLIGYGELYVNGQKVGSDVLTPAVTEFREGVPYVTYDLAPFLKKGRNCVAVWLGRGWATHFPDGMKSRKTPAPAVRLQCVLGDGDPAREIVTDGTWKVAPSPYRTLGSQWWNQFGGESYDARLEQPGWNGAGFDDTKWSAAQVLALPEVRALGQIAPLNRLGPPMLAQSVTDLGNGSYELDFGTTLAGWLELRIPALSAGQKVSMTYADLRKPLDPSKTGAAILPGAPGVQQPWNYQHFNQHDEFISNGKAGVFCSKFNYHGFRYVVVNGLTSAPELADASARLIEADVAVRGAFECSNPLFNRIHALHLWTVRCLNLGAYMVDCPHRERLGYGDGQVSAETCLYNFDYSAFYTKWLGDWRAVQIKSTGEVPHTTPRWGGGGGPGWGGALASITWRLYLFTGDRQVLERNYDAMRGHLDFIESNCQGNVLRNFGGKWDFIGDWVPPGRGMDTKNWPGILARELFNNCYRVYLWELQQKTAAALGRAEDAARCQAKLDEIRPLIHRTFFDAEKHQYVIDEQSYQLMPLFTGVVPESERAAVIKNLERLILEKNQGHLDTGMLGTYFLVQYLPQIGRNDLLFTIANQKTEPGWGYMAEQGATTLWEQWNGYWSRIHSCFVSLDGWFYESLAGIRPDPSAPGFKQIIIRPEIVGDLKWVNAHHDSPYGRIVSNWKIENGMLFMTVTIPANTTATIFIPAKDAASVTQNGKALKPGNGIQSIQQNADTVRVEVASGRHSFAVPWKPSPSSGSQRLRM